MLHYLDDWVETNNIDYRKNFITRECYEDLQSMIVGFSKLVEVKLLQCPLGYICPGRVNTDVIENFFCNIQGLHGFNNNPTYLQYQKAINTVIISRKMVSTKSNARCKVTVHGAVPYKIHSGKSFKKLQLLRTVCKLQAENPRVNHVHLY